MICPNCQKDSNPASRVCPSCGQYMGGEVLPPPQRGEAVPIYDDQDYWAAPRPGRPVKAVKRQKKRRSKGKRPPKPERYRRRMINWAMVGLVCLILAFAAALGSYVYLKVTPNGQLILARLGREASADAYWRLGTELLDQGYIARSVSTYEQALAMEPDHPELVKRLMLLAEGYEAAGQAHQAEAVYTRIYSQLDRKSPIGYSNAIRLILQRGGTPEAVELMQEAYEQTGDASFASQRAALLPLPPTATDSAGSHLIEKEIGFVSPQGYDIYYATGNELLPDEGIRYTGPLLLGEGVHTFRAICVSQELNSEEMSVRYVVSLPSPPAPKANLAANAYNGVRSVKLRDMETDKKDPKKQNKLYYSLDGRPATIDSPEYVGEAIRLPGGRVTLHAIAVNGYGKVSNQMTVQYTINNVPRQTYFNGKDEFAKFALIKTSYEDFVKLYGEPQSLSPIEDDALGGPSSLARYQWGEARFCQLDNGNMFYEIRTTDAGMTGPRGTKVGMALDEVYKLFRDMGQPPNARGDRGIYYNIKDGYADFTAREGDPTSGELLYVATLFDTTASTRLLRFEIEAGRVQAISLRYVDRKISNVQ